MRYGPTTYSLTEIAYDGLREIAVKRHMRIREVIDNEYVDWTSRALYIKDDELRELWETRIAQGVRSEWDHVLYQAMYVEYGGRFPRTLDLSVECVGALSLWAVKYKLPHKQKAVQPVGLAALALEMFGRGWTQ